MQLFLCSLKKNEDNTAHHCFFNTELRLVLKGKELPEGEGFPLQGHRHLEGPKGSPGRTEKNRTNFGTGHSHKQQACNRL